MRQFRDSAESWSDGVPSFQASCLGSEIITQAVCPQMFALQEVNNSVASTIYSPHPKFPKRTHGGDAGNRTRVHYYEPQSSTGVAYESVLLGPALCEKHPAKFGSNPTGYARIAITFHGRLVSGFHSPAKRNGVEVNCLVGAVDRCTRREFRG